MNTHCGHIVAHDVSWAVQTGRHSLQTQNVSKFVSAINVAYTGKQGNICVGNNVSSFARAFSDVYSWFINNMFIFRRQSVVSFPLEDKHIVNEHLVLQKGHDATENCPHVVHFNLPCDWFETNPRHKKIKKNSWLPYQ